MQVVNGVAYVAADDQGGLQIINVSNPAAPVVISSYNTPGAANSLAVVGANVYVADGFPAKALRIFEVSNPAHPILRGSFDLTGDPHHIVVAGDMAYVAAGYSGGLQIIDVSNPAAPLLRSQVSGFFNAYAVAVDGGGMAYVAEGGNLRLVDVSDPAH